MKTLSFLDNLVMRNLPETAVIQPRPVSLFEPWPGMTTGIPPFISPVSVEAETAVSPAASYPPSTPQTQPLLHPSLAWDTAVPPPSTPPPSPAKPAPIPAPTQQIPITQQPVQQQAPSVQPASTPTAMPLSPVPAHPLRRQLPVDDPLANIKPVLPPQPALLPLTTANAMPVPPNHQGEVQPPKQANNTVFIEEHLTLLRPVSETPIKTLPTLVEIVREQPVQPLSPGAAPAAIIPEQPLKPATPPIPIRADQIKPFTPANDWPTNQPPVATPPAPASTVQITIGRIEVRATPPAPTKVEKRPAPTPLLSLDEYLRQHSGGQP